MSAQFELNVKYLTSSNHNNYKLLSNLSYYHLEIIHKSHGCKPAILVDSELTQVVLLL